MSNKIIPGMACILDNTNQFKFSEADTVIVTTLRVIKRSLFRKRRVWEVSYEELNQATMQYDTYTLKVQERYLMPKYTYVIRNPILMPVITDIDIQAINIAINNTNDKNNKNRLIIVREKLELFKSLREV